MTLLLIFALIFAVTFGITWASFKAAARNKPVGIRKILVISFVVSAVLMLGITMFLANGFGSLPNQ